MWEFDNIKNKPCGHHYDCRNRLNLIGSVITEAPTKQTDGF